MGLPFRPQPVRFGGEPVDFDGTRERVRRALLEAPDPARVAEIQEADAIQQLITRNLQPTPVREVPRGQMIVDALIAGLGNQEPGVGGLGGFVSDVARSAGAVRGVARQLEAQTVGRQAAAEETRQDTLLRALQAKSQMELRRAQAEAERNPRVAGTPTPAAAVQEAQMLAQMTPEQYKVYQERKRGLERPAAPSTPPVITFQQAPNLVTPGGSPVRFNPRTGNYEPAGVAGGTVAPRPKPLTDDQAKAAGFAARVQDAITTFDGLDAQGTKPPSDLARKATGVPIINKLVPDQAQVFSNAERQFINAVLRRESGAAISPSEFASARAEYIPQDGDGPETKKRKAQNRRRALESLRLSSGPQDTDPYAALAGEYQP